MEGTKFSLLGLILYLSTSTTWGNNLNGEWHSNWNVTRQQVAFPKLFPDNFQLVECLEKSGSRIYVDGERLGYLIPSSNCTSVPVEETITNFKIINIDINGSDGFIHLMTRDESERPMTLRFENLSKQGFWLIIEGNPYKTYFSKAK